MSHGKMISLKIRSLLETIYFKNKKNKSRNEADNRCSTSRWLYDGIWKL